MMATQRVRIEFHCGSGLVFHHDVPARIVGANAIGPGFREAYISAMAPIMKEHQDECLAASQKKCACCETADSKQALMTPCSYLHIPNDPVVHVFVMPVCEKQSCNDQGQADMNAMMAEVTGMAEGQVTRGGPVEYGDSSRVSTRISRNAACPCGSSRKYKKCCGAA
ncbi:hypothetical protein JX266_000235 [Neoarthrinium moseri]|nr:hypothetical protein JX266_000235 [Neoarthrinium moseri]